MAISITQQGTGFPFFGLATFKYLCSDDLKEIEVSVGETPDPIVWILIEKVRYMILQT